MQEELYVRLQNILLKLRIYFENPNQLDMSLYLKDIANELAQIGKEIEEHSFSLMEF